jgi:ubiquinol-cytochrome c reductase cytochrome b subunit
VLSRLRDWASDRFGWQQARKVTLDRRVPRSPWYYGDGATLMLLLGVLVATGVAMAFTYSPHTDSAYASVRHLTERQVLGRFVRALHYWSAGAMVVMLCWHVLRQILVAGYKAPREGTWLVGVGLFVGVLIMSYTGYLLRWDERAIHGVRISLHIFSRVPFIGESLVLMVQGGAQPGPLLLTRLYAVHVLLVPLLIGGLVLWHLYLVLLHGTTTRGEQQRPVKTAEEQRVIYESEKKDPDTGETFYPETMAQSGAMAGVVLLVVVALALLVGPGPLMPEANLTDRSFPAEEWWWWWFSGMVALLPNWMAPWFVLVFPLGLILALVLLPLVDRSARRGMGRRPWAVGLVILVAVALFALSGWRLRSPWTGWPTETPPALPPEVVISAEAERGRQLFALQGCTSCHSVAGEGGRKVAVDLATLDPPRSREHLRDYIRQPPLDVAMPAYEGWATDEQIERLVDYVLAAQTFPRER